ncbi:hypothetical protein ER308_03290 [Egibacter rhizosphaerae]|uniref:Cell wall-binding repeat-containing protein n=1 Tax=Egibacter rhizosphaerae TaxID=1670831 RepID=A0A411YBX0_9ACTN|nr:cell wall-binding repeat-containing protein [Egibacter rhizosphaerae]QBI18678.1 hypothetical protein ER308_03290 [Egibacter rhizosphaerae]
MTTTRTRVSALLLATVVLIVLVSWAATDPAAADESCTGTIGATTIDDNVVVPDGATCTLDGTTVEGNVLVGSGASLTALDAEIDGNIQDDDNNAGDVTVEGTVVHGNIQLEDGAGATVTATRIDGDLQLEANDGALAADDNTIDGNLQANQNTGGLDITDNTIDGNLQCQSNDPAPTGGGNTVRGDAEGQCSDLSGAPDNGDDEDNGEDEGDARPTRRLAGNDRYETAVAISEEAFATGADVVYLARGDEAADALAGKSLSDGPILLVPQCGSLPGAVASEIDRLDPDEVVTLGGSSAVCDAIVEEAAAS